MKRAIVGITAILAGAFVIPTVTASAASAAPSAAFIYWTYAACVAAGDQGVQEGRWASYRCVPVLITLGPRYYRLEVSS